MDIYVWILVAVAVFGLGAYLVTTAAGTSRRVMNDHSRRHRYLEPDL